MKKEYDKIFITHIPSFYKINLYNQIAKQQKIFVIFLFSDTSEKRMNDFLPLNRSNFEYRVLATDTKLLSARLKVQNYIALLLLLGRLNATKVFVNGWELLAFWVPLLIIKKSKLCVVVESFGQNSEGSLLLRIAKRLFLTCVSECYLPYKRHERYVKELGFKGNIKYTYGVGIINKNADTKSSNILRTIDGPYFLFVGRLVDAKNINHMVSLMGSCPEHCKFVVVGEGDQHNVTLKESKNIIYLGALESNIVNELMKSASAVLLLSKHEAWGLVVEEALYVNTPVLLSGNVGCSDFYQGLNGVHIMSEDLGQREFNAFISSLIDYKPVNTLDFIEKKDKWQVGAYNC